MRTFPRANCFRRVVSALRVRSLLATIAALSLPFLLAPAAAQSQTFASETWVGAEAFHRTWSLYSGVTLAPGASITTEGVRLRAVVGQGQYRTAAQGVGVSPFVDALAGYQMHRGALTLKLFAGATGVANIESRRDLADLWSHTRVGPKLVLETWWAISPSGWTSLDVSWTGVHDVAYVRSRSGVRLMPALSLGIEGAMVASGNMTSLRAGPLLRYEWVAGEVSVSGGITSDTASMWSGSTTPEREPGGYLTLNWLQRF